MSAITTIYKVLHQPVNLLRELNLDRQITFGNVLSLSGIALFLLALAWVPTDGAVTQGSDAVYAAKADTACGFFWAAGLFVASGWLQQRHEADAWPFNSRLLKKVASGFAGQTLKIIGPFILAVLGMLCLTSVALHF